MRIVFMGTPEFALPSLQILLRHNLSIVAVVTAPDRPQGRGRRISFSPIKEFALRKHLPVLQPEHLKDPSFVTMLSSLQPDLIVVVAFRILPKEVFEIPRLGSFNLHASLLPKYRGAAPINWAIINGEQETGVTTFFLKERVDTGSIILQARVRIGPDETAGELHDKLSEVGAEIVLQTIRLIELGKVRTRMQDDSLASSAPKIFKEDCRIDWHKNSQQVHDFVRGLSPQPCAWTLHRGKLLRFFRTKQISWDIHRDLRPGAIADAEEGGLLVQTGKGLLSILELQQEGHKPMDVAEFLRGYRLGVGDELGE